MWFVGIGSGTTAAQRVSGVKVEIMAIARAAGSLRWRITNQSNAEVYVYDVFLLGPALEIERDSGMAVFSTTPSNALASCPPNRLLPPLLMVIRSGGTIEGEFSDLEIKKLVSGTRIALKIAVGPEPDSVMSEWQRYLKSDCKHSPYDAIVNWATMVQSKPLIL
jgi:hypothetical protein